MKTTHKVIFANSQNMKETESKSTALVITSPPYPIIDMWDLQFSNISPAIQQTLDDENGLSAFEFMHQELDKVWREVYRVLVDGGIACINIGDAVRTFRKNFQLYSNYSRIVSFCTRELGLQTLPCIIWRKPTNAPNKFMGSGMLPAGAYVTLEHEYIIILRKGGKRAFKTADAKKNRRESAFFWEERNEWFSDIWNIKGVSQKLNNDKMRERSAAFPFELAYRLVNMYSVKGDTVLDPFVGTCTTTLAAICAARNSIGYEIEESFRDMIMGNILGQETFLNSRIKNRLKKHGEFVKKRVEEDKKEIKHVNTVYGFPVITKQEIELSISRVKSIDFNEAANAFSVEHYSK